MEIPPKIPDPLPREIPPYTGPRLVAIPQFPNSIILYQTSMSVVELSDGVVVKSGEGIHLEEANALRLAEELQLPVPRVYKAEPMPNQGASIHIDYVPGESLKDVWPTMTSAQKHDIATQLRSIIDKMRSATSDSNSIRACGGGEVHDLRSYDSYTGGPFQDEHAFNAFILDFPPSTPNAIRTALTARLRSGHHVMSTHGDLSQHNILVKDNKITGLIDWEYSGWFPEYWEYIKFFERPTPHNDWSDYAGVIFSQPYTDELVDYQAISHWHRP